MNQLTLINNSATTANTKSTDAKSRNAPLKLKATKKQIKAFMFHSSDNVSPTNTSQLNSRMLMTSGGSAGESLSPAVTSYSNGQAPSMKNSLFNMDNSN